MTLTEEESLAQDSAAPRRGMNRRDLLLGGAGALGGAVAGGLTVRALQPELSGEKETKADTEILDALSGSTSKQTRLPVPAMGRHQAGIHLPERPQTNTLVIVADLDGTNLSFLPALGTEIARLANGGPSEMTPDGPGTLTVTVGIGPRLVSAIDPRLPAAQPLPVFTSDSAVEEQGRGGDLLLSLCTDDPSILDAVAQHLLTLVPGVQLRWRQRGFRPVGEGTIARNPFGFTDGVIVPRGTEELEQNVWIPDGPAAAGTVCVIRRISLDTEAFRARPVREREAIIGRELVSGSPLSGGDPHDQLNLRLKSPEGNYLVPSNAHARVANPSFTGSQLMLRRSYSYDNGESGNAEPGGLRDAGLIFTCFQRDIETFVKTQRRLDEQDALAPFMTARSSAVFLVMPGFSLQRGLGSTLR